MPIGSSKYWEKAKNKVGAVQAFEKGGFQKKDDRYQNAQDPPSEPPSHTQQHVSQHSIQGESNSYYQDHPQSPLMSNTDHSSPAQGYPYAQPQSMYESQQNSGYGYQGPPQGSPPPTTERNFFDPSPQGQTRNFEGGYGDSSQNWVDPNASYNSYSTWAHDPNLQRRDTMQVEEACAYSTDPTPTPASRSWTMPEPNNLVPQCGHVEYYDPYSGRCTYCDDVSRRTRF